jgi:hypothetical protein
MSSTERKMAAILAMDVTSYSEKMGRDEEGTLKHLRACREIIETVVNEKEFSKKAKDNPFFKRLGYHLIICHFRFCTKPDNILVWANGYFWNQLEHHGKYAQCGRVRFRQY